MVLIKFIMSSIGIESLRPRSKSAISKNYKNIHLHACLDEAKIFQDRVHHHESLSKFNNHTLNSAERFYKQSIPIKPMRSASASRLGQAQSSEGFKIKLVPQSSTTARKNPQQVMGGLQNFAETITALKIGFDSGIENRMELKRRIEKLKQQIKIQKNRKAKVSLHNSKLMNLNQRSNHEINRLTEQSRRNQILIKEVEDEVRALEKQNNQLRRNNMQCRQNIDDQKNNIDYVQKKVNEDKRSLMQERKNLENVKEAETISYKQMTNFYMYINQLKEEKALLLNSVHLDVINNTDKEF